MQGIVVYAVPDRGAAYSSTTERQLAMATCVRRKDRGA
jgi:hypothetical protein